ncbi:hypothetical protein GPUN_1028 [Glaciecola punicea ACAM 611]|jgi:UPF0271 protein|uniref:Uncharacterized protein n=1 Tax=Glaciecola punicea ACAM 611 TaxID=1121923 RepID=H5TA32_9ALTE|nr:5-oxoprolinase subunit PxpA [Glaciecola punicea]OFA33445.1 hypothetical protein BAE46_01705 [Glaciecola punicea]GAB55159.1 hypothetical protein GPUN_1028 [Glaciecola punicea ACAM 611]
MKLNADIGESYGKWTMGNDSDIMPLVDQANIACGYHAGDALTMQNTISLAAKHAVEVGAHVSYPDLQGFGRRSMQLSSDELIAMIHAQIATLEGMAKCQSAKIGFVKPHGAMYNDMMQQPALFESIVMALASYHCRYDLVIQALPDVSIFCSTAAKHNIPLRFEGFADRGYTASGFLVSRDKPKAVLSETQSLFQASAMINGDAFLSECGNALALHIDTICVHSDTPDSLILCRKIRSLISKQVSTKSVHTS